MNRFLPGLLAISFAAPLALAAPAGATTIELSWSTCNPIVTTYTPTGPAENPDPIYLFVNGVGQEATHTGFEFRVNLENMGATLPDAWRFDAAGCQGPSQIVLHTFSLVKACPTFQGSNPTTTFSFGYEPNSFPGPPGAPPFRFALKVSNRYAAKAPPAGGAMQTLARVTFLHDFSVAGPTNPGFVCGGFEENVCVSLHPEGARWFDASGSPVDFVPGQASVYFRGDCRPVPAAPSTWGLIKGQYRR